MLSCGCSSIGQWSMWVFFMVGAWQQLHVVCFGGVLWWLVFLVLFLLCQCGLLVCLGSVFGFLVLLLLVGFVEAF